MIQKIRIFVGGVWAICLLSLPVYATAQDSQILSVTPPLFQLSALPGDIWQSSVKVVNGNAYPISVYAEVVNFQAYGEAGQGKFLPVLKTDDVESQNTTLAEWIEIAGGPYEIPAEQTKDISFFVEMPDSAPPGGHYAAILISTEPPKEGGETAVKTAQAVTSLFFVRIEGDIHEEAAIREFRVTDRLLDRPEAEFSLRFENKGNVHLQPKGDIVITNMWGSERGKIPVNYQTHFGNVLPESVRDFKFAWKSDFSITDIGRYKALVTLAYGEDGVKSVTSTAYFWIIPIKATLITLTVLAIFITLITLMVKAYVRKMLTMAGVDVDAERAQKKQKDTVGQIVTPKPKPPVRYAQVSAPIKSGVLDLRKQLSTVDETADFVGTIWNFVCTYKKFFASLVVLIVIFITVVLYIGRATEEHTRYSVTIDEEGEKTTIEGADVDEVLPE